MKYCLFLLLSFLFIQCYTSGPTSDLRGMPNEPGKCYAKCLMPDMYEEVLLDELFVYTGDTLSENVDLQRIVKEIEPAGTKWVKKKADNNCRSADPNDCLVWCLVEVPGYYEEYFVVMDTSQTSNFRTEENIEKRLVKRGGFVEWQEVICAHNLTPVMIENIQAALEDEGYSISDDYGVYGSSSKKAMTKFQKDNELPIGQLDIESLFLLQVDIE